MTSGVEPTRRVLLIEDSFASRRLVSHMLAPESVVMLEAEDGRLGFELATKELPDLILLDLRLPGWDGFETLRNLKEEVRTRKIPVIFLTAEEGTAAKAKAFDMGAVDFVSKPFDPIELRARVRAALRAKQAQDLLEQKANLDGLTGLGNRHALIERLSLEWSQSLRHGSPLTVIMADLDRFKVVNDCLGHAAGDSILQGAAESLRKAIRGGDFVARYGGEEFVIVANNCELSGAIAIAQRFRRSLASLSEPYNPHGHDLTASVGLSASFDPSLSGPEDLIRQADAALYRAKEAGRDAVWVCDRGMFRPAMEPSFPPLPGVGDRANPKVRIQPG